MNREIFLKILTFLTTVGLGVSGWFFNETFTRLKSMEDDIGHLKIQAAEVAGNRFSSSDFVKAKEIIDSQIVATDKRVLVLEESQKTIKEYLFEIRADLKEIKGTQRN